MSEHRGTGNLPKILLFRHKLSSVFLHDLPGVLLLGKGPSRSVPCITSSLPSQCLPPQPMAPWKTQRARSPPSRPLSGQGQGHGIPAPPPGNALPCTPAAAENPPANRGDHPESETGGLHRPQPFSLSPSLGLFPFSQHHGRPPGGCRLRTPSCIPRRTAAACCGVNSGAARPRGDRI